jgi:hypothetical protein
MIAAQITDHVEFDPALAINFTIYTLMPSGGPGDTDIFGASNMARCFTLRCPTVDDGPEREVRSG